MQERRLREGLKQFANWQSVQNFTELLGAANCLAARSSGFVRFASMFTGLFYDAVRRIIICGMLPLVGQVFFVLSFGASIYGSAHGHVGGAPEPYEDPAITVILQAVTAQDPAYLIVNENHNVDWHRHVSACVLAAVALHRRVVFAAEAFPYGRPPNSRILSSGPGYTGSHFFQDIWRAIAYFQIESAGYDPSLRDGLSDGELAERGLSSRIPNRRDRVAAERLERLRLEHGPDLMVLHVGHAHVSERWTSSEDGNHGWLAAHLAQLSGTDPLTVYQMTPEEMRWYVDRRRFVFEPGDCENSREEAVLLKTASGVIGCAPRARLQSSHDADFIVLDGVSPGENARNRTRVCEIPGRN